MDILGKIKTETNIEILREEALKHLTLLYNAMTNASYKAEVFEFILGNMDLTVDFEYFENPKVSIIIPVKDEFIMTSALLNSIKKNTQGIEYEIIIADDNSEDEIQYIEQLYKNVRRIVNDTGHEGFIWNINNAISKAKGDYIFAMNNDMLTQEGYLTELLKVMENDETIGIASSKTLNIDGTVKECGIKMLKNGKVLFLGSDEPSEYEDDKQYIECDYCSGCSILFKKSVWEKAGKFDAKLEPAYYEDSDFAFNLKYNFGLKSVCVPKSKLFHFQGISYSNNVNNDNVKKNREYFLKKWGKYIKN